MSDPADLVGVGVGGASLGALGLGLLKFLGSRQVSQLDETLKMLHGAVRDLDLQVRDLREQLVGFAKDVGALQEGQKALGARIDGQATHYRERFDRLQEQINELSRRRGGK